jgi:hypothetical protein
MKQKQSQRVVVNIGAVPKQKRKRRAPKKKAAKPPVYAPMPQPVMRYYDNPLPARQIEIRPPAIEAPKIIPKALPDTEHPAPLPLAPRVPLAVPANLADTEHLIVPLGPAEPPTLFEEEPLVYAGGLEETAAELAALGEQAKAQEEIRAGTAGELAGLGERAKAQEEIRTGTAGELAGLGEQAKAQEEIRAGTAGELAGLGERAKAQGEARAGTAGELAGLGERAKAQGEARAGTAGELAGLVERAKAQEEAKAGATRELAGFVERAKAKREAARAGLVGSETAAGLVEEVPVEPLEPDFTFEPRPEERMGGWRGSEPAGTRILVGQKLPPLTLSELVEAQPPEPTGTITFAGGGDVTARPLKPQSYEGDQPKTSRLAQRKSDLEARGQRERPAILAGETVPQAAARQASEAREDELQKAETARKPKEPDPAWYAEVRKTFGELNKSQKAADIESGWSEAEAKKLAEKRRAAYKNEGKVSNFTVAVPEAVYEAPLKGGFAPVGQKQISEGISFAR